MVAAAMPEKERKPAMVNGRKNALFIYFFLGKNLSRDDYPYKRNIGEKCSLSDALDLAKANRL